MAGPNVMFPDVSSTVRATAPPPTAVRWNRAVLMQVGFLAFAVALVGKAAKVQLFERDEWRARARTQQLAATPLPAPRGTILDQGGAVLVESRQLVKLAIAPPEVAAVLGKRADAPTQARQRLEGLARALARAGVSPEWVSRVRDTTRKWVELPGRFLATDVAAITTEVNRIMEGWIRAQPGQWMWLHRRWPD